MENSTLAKRVATAADAPFVVHCIHELAEAEGRPGAATVTPQLLAGWIESGAGVVWVLESGGEDVGYMIHYPVFSSFWGKRILYLEDVCIKKTHRGSGLGRQAMGLATDYARENGYAALQWSCLTTNEKSLHFYEALGATRKPDTASFMVAF